MNTHSLVLKLLISPCTPYNLSVYKVLLRVLLYNLEAIVN